MSDPKEVTYSVIKSLDIQSAVNASDKSTTAERTMKRNDSTVWDQTVSCVMEAIDLQGYTPDNSKEGITALLQVCKGIMSKSLMEVLTIPEVGKDRNGKDLLLTNKDGTVKWSSWSSTRRIFAYLGDIAKIIAHDKQDVMYPEKFKVGARCDVLKLCVAPKVAIEQVRRLVGDLEGFLDVVPKGADAMEAMDLTQALQVSEVEPLHESLAIINRLGRSLAGISDEDKPTVMSALKSCISTHLA